jgi:hypothetical protein
LAPAEARGIEDARFVRFHDEEGRSTYYATYTAFDGQVPLPQLLETEDFVRFKISTLNGPEVQDKGMALFPRKVCGHRPDHVTTTQHETCFACHAAHVKGRRGTEVHCFFPCGPKANAAEVARCLRMTTTNLYATSTVRRFAGPMPSDVYIV